MNTLKLKIGFWAILCMAVGFGFLFYSSTVNHILGPDVAFAFDDPGCTNEDCPPDPGCTNEDCPPDPGCTNEDCPPDPGCTNEDCPPDYWEGCCCYEEYNQGTGRTERICCCNEDQNVTCRRSYVTNVNPPLHERIDEIFVKMDPVPGDEQGLLTPNWFIPYLGDACGPLSQSCDWWSRLQPQPCPLVGVIIDIKPGSYPNCFNNDDKGVIPVAIFSNPNIGFDATQIKPSTVRLEGIAIKAVGKSDKLLSHIEDVNNDGYNDMVVQIQDQDGVFTAGDTQALVTGYLLDGTPFEGSDSICIVPQ